jgi:hypothetical protein
MSFPRISCLVFSVPATSIPNSGIYGTNSTDNQPPDRGPKGFDKNGPAIVPLPRDRIYVLIQICSLPASDSCRTDVITIRLRGSPLYARRCTKLRPVCMRVNPYGDQFACAAAAR